MVWNHGTNPVTCLYARLCKSAMGLGHTRIQLMPGRCGFNLVLTPEDESWRSVISFQQVFGIVQFCIREKSPSRHLVGIDKNAPAPRLGFHATEIPQSGPKGLRVIYRKLQYILIGLKLEIVCAIDLTHEAVKIRTGLPRL